jgi:hypothetical protein
LHDESKPADVEEACRDLWERSLARLPGDFARLIYLASTRDYNSGEYHHAGLVRQFGESATREALASCHREVFGRLVRSSITELVEQLEVYVRSTRLPVSKFARSWGQLHPHQVTVPLDCGALTARFFTSNVMAALAILAARQNPAQSSPQPALPEP